MNGELERRYMTALGQLKLEVNREIDAIQTGELPRPQLLAAVANVETWRRRVGKARQS